MTPKKYMSKARKFNTLGGGASFKKYKKNGEEKGLV